MSTVLAIMMAMPGQPVRFTVKDNPATVIEVITSDGKAYEIKIALIVPFVFDTGMRSPLDGLPIFHCPAQAAIQVTPKVIADA